MGFEFTDYMEIKEFCGAAWSSNALKGKEGNPYCPLLPPRILPEGFDSWNWVNRNAVQQDSTFEQDCRISSITYWSHSVLQGSGVKSTITVSFAVRDIQSGRVSRNRDASDVANNRSNAFNVLNIECRNNIDFFA